MKLKFWKKFGETQERPGPPPAKKRRPKKSKQPKPPKEARPPVFSGVGDDLKKEWPVVLTAVISVGAFLAVILYGVLISPK